MTFSEATWQGVLPGRPEPFFLDAGDGERSVAFDQLFTILLSKDETDGQFGCFTMEARKGDTIVAHSHIKDHETFFVVEGEVKLFLEDHEGNQVSKLLTPGDFGFVPATYIHAFRVESSYTKVFGTCTAGFERFFHDLGQPTDDRGAPEEFFMPSREQMGAAFQKYGNIPKLDQQWQE
jgi:quercetin 2,3-dioxygenase